MATYDLAEQSAPNSSAINTGDIINCSYSGSTKSITLPPGTYVLECWGAQGGASSYHGTQGGLGGYSKGTYTISSATTLYLNVGGQGNTGSYGVYGGWNGGGGVTDKYNYGGSGNHLGSGGGATDISTVAGTCSLDSYYRYVRTAESYNGRIIVAGGGGGAEGLAGTGGGGTTGVSDSYGSYGGSQSSAGAINYGASSSDNWVDMYAGGLGYGVSTSGGHISHAMGSCGGGGYYGGGAYGYNGEEAHGYGGSGYVSSILSGPSMNEAQRSGHGYIRITVSSVNNWAYTTSSISAPTLNKQTTSSITLTQNACKCYSFTPTISGPLIVYGTGTGDNYGYLCSSAPTLNINGQPTTSQILTSNDDSARLYGGTSNGSFGFVYNVTAGTTYYLYIKPYSSNTSSQTITVTYWMGHPDTRIFIKIDNTTWKRITA